MSISILISHLSSCSIMCALPRPFIDLFCIVYATAIDEFKTVNTRWERKISRSRGHGSQRRAGLDNSVHPGSTKNEIRIVRRRNIALLKWDVSNDKRARQINIAPDWYDGARKADGDCEMGGNLFVNRTQEMRSRLICGLE
ncbi:hypothetical protein B0H13DRAFT_1872511 [Mycena leptocephala]|nr:hypothetical protein B0H13DRAFT_1872511 [Mycena leptocephala]